MFSRWRLIRLLPRPLPPPLPSIFLSLPVCCRSSFLTVDVGRSGGGAKSHEGEKAKSSINRSIGLVNIHLDSPVEMTETGTHASSSSVSVDRTTQKYFTLFYTVLDNSKPTNKKYLHPKLKHLRKLRVFAQFTNLVLNFENVQSNVHLIIFSRIILSVIN